MPAKVRHAETLKELGFTGELDLFRETLADVKREKFSGLSVDELCFTRDEAAEFCKEVKRRLGAPRLTRVFILRSLVGLRKNGKRGVRESLATVR